jgi:hypothetical protein
MAKKATKVNPARPARVVVRGSKKTIKSPSADKPVTYDWCDGHLVRTYWS